MNKHLKAAATRYTIKDALINPISDIDAEIIAELIIISKRLKLGDIKVILEHWKYLKDTDVRDLLLGWNIEHPDKIEDEESDENFNKRKFVNFEGSIIEASLIKSVHVLDYYNYSLNKMEYRIVINKDLPESYLLTDLVFSYVSDKLRKKKLESLKEILGKFIKII